MLSVNIQMEDFPLKNGSPRCYQGWNSEGIKCFNELFDLVKVDRQLAHAKPFREAFKVYCENGGVLGMKTKKKQVMFEAIHVWHELWSDDEEINVAGNQIMNLEKAVGDEVDEEEVETPLPI